MNIQYMLMKDKYRFVHTYKLLILSTEDALKRRREISLYLKELSLYGISLVSLAKVSPPKKIRDMLLNIAYICIEDTKLYDDTTKLRQLPIKPLCRYTGKNRGFFERWQSYILAYMIALTNPNYTNLRGYLNIEAKSEPDFSRKELTPIYNESSSDSDYNNVYTGIVLKCGVHKATILTSQGLFINVKINKDERPDTASVYQAQRAKDLSFYKYPLGIALSAVVFMAIVSSFIFFRVEGNILISANSTIRLQVNRFQQVVNITPLSPYGRRIAASTKTRYQSVDKSILLILKNAREQGIIDENTNISIHISGSIPNTLNISKTSGYIIEHNLKVQINQNGRERRIREPNDSSD
jgi:hypothetical protein